MHDLIVTGCEKLRIVGYEDREIVAVDDVFLLMRQNDVTISKADAGRRVPTAFPARHGKVVVRCKGGFGVNGCGWVEMHDILCMCRGAISIIGYGR